VDYCAANAVLDAFAHAGSAAGAPWVAIDWDTWREVGMAVALRGTELRGLSSEEGGDAFLRAVAYGAPQIAVSQASLARLIRRSREPQAAPGASGAAPRAAFPRPDLESGYAAPRNDIEAQIAAIWEEVLALERVGIHDEFSELGGDSLIATQVCSRVRRQFAVALPLQALFASPTVAALAMEVVRNQAETAGGEHLADLIDRLESLSDEDVERLLARKEGKG
jgi:acyl carrier protein